MSQPTTQRPRGHHRFNLRNLLSRQPLGLPMFEVLWGVLFFLGITAALALAIWSSLANGPVPK
jgi:hypothetical protein